MIHRSLSRAVVSMIVPLFVSCQEHADPKAILLKAIAAHGGEKNIAKPRLGVIKGLSGKSSISDMTFVETFDLPKRWRRVTEMTLEAKKPASHQLIIDGKLWDWDEGQDAQEAKNDGKVKPYFSALTVLLDISHEKIKLLPLKKTKINERAVAGLRASWDGGAADYYFDSETGFLTQTVARVSAKADEEVDYKVVWGKHKEVDGVQLPHRMTSYIKGGPFPDWVLAMDVLVTDVRILEVLDDNVFALPKKK